VLTIAKDSSYFLNTNVGIGTTSPDAKLEVSDTTTGIGAIIGNTTHNSRLQIYTEAAGKNSEIWFGDAADDNVGIIDYDHATDSMSFFIGATKRLSFDSAGTMLLGDTTTAYQTIFFDPTPSTVYGNGTLQIQPTTSPGSGIAQFTTNFADRVGVGTTKHNVRVGGTVTATDFIGGSGAYLPLAGGTMTGTNGVLMPDNFKLKFGTSSDLEIYHDASNSYIRDNGIGDLRFMASNIKFYDNATAELMAQMIPNGAVELYYNNSKKFETTSTGVSVTGVATANSFTSSTDSGININGITLTRVAVNSAIRVADGLETLGLLRSYAGLNVATSTVLGSTTQGNTLIVTSAQGSLNTAFSSAGNGGYTQYQSGNDGIYGYIGSGSHLLSPVVNDNDFVLRAQEEFAVSIGATEKMRINSSGGVSFAGTVTAPTFQGDLNGTINTATTAVTKANATNDTTVATTAFVQNLIGTIPAGLVFQGAWNAATNTPTLTSGSGTTGHFYIVSTSGSTNLDGVTDWVTGDWAVFIEQGGTDAWEKIDNSSVLDGAGTGNQITKWSGSGTSNTLTDSIITDNGTDVGIGTTSPTFKLHVNSTDASDNVAYIHHNNAAQSSGDVLKVRSDAGDNAGSALLNVANNTGSALYVRGDRNVGIGTTSPGYKLSVSGNIGLTDGVSTGLLALVGGNYYIQNTGAYSTVFQTNGAERMRITSAGDTGIGVTTPRAKLDVAGGIKVADDTDTAVANKEGTLRYRLAPSSPKSQSMVDMCMKTGPSSYAWVNIVTNTWSN
jgi:hypothetical protein